MTTPGLVTTYGLPGVNPWNGGTLNGWRGGTVNPPVASGISPNWPTAQQTFIQPFMQQGQPTYPIRAQERFANSIAQQYGQVNLPKANSSGIIQIPRSTNQGAAITASWNQNTANRTAANQTITDFTKNYLSQGPQAKAFTEQETGAVGRFYGSGPGSVAGDLAAIERRRGNAVTQAAESAIRRASRANSIRRMGSGNNSANDRWYAQQVGNIAAQTAAERAQNDAANYRYVADSQRGLAGQRQKLLNDLTMRDLTPLDVSQRYEGNSLANIGALGNLEDRNTIYDDTALRRQLLQNLMLN